MVSAMAMASAMTSTGNSSPKHKVFINFRGEDLRCQFLPYLVSQLKKSNLCIDVEKRSGDFAETVQSITESKIALVIISTMYTNSLWCLDELVEITRRVDDGKLVAIPILYEVDASVVKGLEGHFGVNLWNHVNRTSEFDKLKKWKEALDFISHKLTLMSSENSDEPQFITRIVKEIKRQLNRISTDQFKKIPDQLSEQQKYALTDSCFSRSKKLKTVDNETDIGILWNAKSDVNPEETELNGKSRKDDNLPDGANSDATPNLQNIFERRRVDSVKEEKKYVQVGEGSTVSNYDINPQCQVFINFQGEDVGFGFVSHLISALLEKGVNVFIDKDEGRDEDISKHFKTIEDSKIAVTVFSSKYSESRWCLDELVKIKECMDKGKLEVIPIFYKVEPSQVQQLNGDFGDKLWNLWNLHRDPHIINWKEALESVASLETMRRLWLEENSSEGVFVTSIVEEVNKVLTKISLQEEQNPPWYQSGKDIGFPAGTEEKPETFPDKDPLFGIDKRMEQLEQKLEFDCSETRIIGVVGMPGIGKTTLAMMLHEKWNCKFVRCVPLLGIRKKWKDYGPVWLRTTLIQVLLGGEIPGINVETTHDTVKSELLETKVFVVLDDVSDKKQLEFLLGDLKWIKKGSRIVITTCDKSLLEGLAHDTYLVPQMDSKDAFQLFSYHALDDQDSSPPERLLTRSRISVDNAGGNPLALKLMGNQLRGKGKSHSLHKLKRRPTQSSNTNILDVWKVYIDQLNQQQKDVFLDIVWFFRSEDEYFVRSILDSGDPDSTDPVSEVRDLVNKSLITISDSRVEMNYLVYTFGENLGSSGRHKLWRDKDIINKLTKLEKIDTNNVRGIFLDMFKLTNHISLECTTFTNMHNLRYLKIYDSCCPQAGYKLNFPYELKLPLKEVRYLHWEKFPLEEVPSDFEPENLVDLRLPYSNIKRVWKGIKDTPRLKWVDLSHSQKLLDLSGFSKAESIQRLNLEGCITLDELPGEIQYMKSLVFLNLRGCIRLRYLPKMNLASLKILILSDCSDLQEFQLISESIEFLHLDATAINGLPLTIKNLQRLVVLNLKNCKMLEYLPSCLGEMKDLEELILSGCSRLKNLSHVKHGMKHLLILRLDGTGAKEMPNISGFTRFEDKVSGSYYNPSEWPQGVNEVYSLERLCLSENDFISLPSDISELRNLKWLDVKKCKKLRSLPMLPPKLQYFDAHGCGSLESVSNPLALQVVTENIHAIFKFSNCKNLDLDAKESIISYTRRKGQLVLDALSRYNGGFALEVLIRTCFPGWNVPAWFTHRAFGSTLKSKLSPHWCDNKFTGIALSAVISFSANNNNKRNHILVKCDCKFKSEDGSHIRLSFTVGGWSEPWNTPHKINSSHVFVGYISRMDINKHGAGSIEEGCIYTEVSLEFQVTDGNEKVVDCKVLQCGLDLVYAYDERDEKAIVIPKRVEKPTTLPPVRYKVQTMICSSNTKIQDIRRSSIHQLNQQQKDALLDIAYFFISEEEYFVRSLLDSENLDSIGAISEVRYLAERNFIEIFDGRVEMNDLMYMFAKNLGCLGRYTMLKYEDIVDKMKNMGKKEANNVRGIFIDMSEVEKMIVLECMTFSDMRNLRYLKIYDSCYPRKCKADCKLYFPDGLRFTLEEIRYLQWLQFPLEELPSDFRPKNLVDLRLPYSKIARLWEGIKETPLLKRVDLSHSSNLLNISALSNAENLRRLNLEGCTVLEELPPEIRNLKSLTFLNMRGCVRLWSLPEINLISLKTLILSDCSSLKEFQLISESLEFLHLDGTSIKGLPPTIKKLRRLVLLNMRNCKMLELLPNSLCELKFLDELILSGCSMLNKFPNSKHSMNHLQVFLFDGTGAKEMPEISCFTRCEGQPSADMLSQPSGSFCSLPRDANRLSLLHRLCLSGNAFVSLQSDIGKLYHLKWLDVKQCKMLRSVPMLPPRLQYFDAHGCDSLERVANPLVRPVMSEHVHATFNFSNCNKLSQDAKDSIISYTRKKSQLMLDALSRYNDGIAFGSLIGTCLPGWEVPEWFSYRACGSVLKPTLPPHWFDNRFTGIALCAVIQFHGSIDQSNISVNCDCIFRNDDGIRIPLSCTIGGWSKSNIIQQTIESSHVFIGYVRRLDVHKQAEGCSFNDTSFEFQVTDGSGEVIVGCDVLKCGFSLVYTPDQRENICWDAKTVAIPKMVVRRKATKKLGKSRSDNDLQYQSYGKFRRGGNFHYHVRTKVPTYQSCRNINPEKVKNALGEATHFGKTRKNHDIQYQPYPR